MAEDFAPGSVDCSRPVELLAGHLEGLRLPVATGRLVEERGGVYGAWPVDPTGLGDHVLAMVRAGKAGGLSVGFHPVPGGDVVDQQNRRLTRLRVELDHVALTEPGMAAYPDAKVLAVRAFVDGVPERGPHHAHSDDASAPHPKAPYGWDVPYADPGYQADKVKRYPLDSEKHVRAAWNYIHHEDNAAKYTAEQLAAIKARIKAAGKEYGIKFSDDEHRLRPEAASLLVEVCRRSPDGDPVADEFAGITDPVLAGRVLELRRRGPDGEPAGNDLWGNAEEVAARRRWFDEQRRRVAETYARPL